MDLGPQRGSSREPLNETIRERRVRRAKGAVPTLSAAVSGPSAGVTVLFIGSMAALTKGSTDTQLGIAVTCFTVALPFLLLAFLFAMMRTGGWSAAFALVLGLLLELVGIAMVLSRLSIPAAVAFGLAVLVCVGWFLQVFLGVSGRDRSALAAWQQAHNEAHADTPTEEGEQ